MCYHFSQNKQESTLERHFRAKAKSDIQIKPSTHINGFDLPVCAVIINEEPQTIQNFSWGLLPDSANDISIRRLTLNARIETLHDKKSFQNYVMQRCLIPATSFFEWEWLNSKGTSKQKYEIFTKKDDLFAFGGLWHRQVLNHQLFETFTILTTEANELMAKIHHTKKRMPVIIKPKDYASFLIGDTIDVFAWPYQLDLEANKVIETGDNFSLF